MIVIFLSLAFLLSLIYIFRLKRDIASINKSLQTIKNAHTNMRLTTITFDKDVCDLSIAVNDVLDKQQQLVIESEKASNEFRQGITNISHDLRTPLTSAVGYIQMMKSNKVTESKKLEYLDIIENRLRSLTALMKELFDYTQVVEGKLDVNLEKVNIGNVLCEQLSSFYEDFSQKGFQVEVDIPNTPVFAVCDAHLLARVSQNLIKNVLAHGTERFELVVQETERTIIFRNKVADLGGLEVDRLFERFYTTDASRSSKRTGLGLAITKEIVLSMDGEISACVEGDMLSIRILLP